MSGESDRPPRIQEQPDKSVIAPEATNAPEAISDTVLEELADTDLDKDTQRVVATRIEQRLTQIAPIPPPSMLAEYDRYFPGLGRELIEAWKGQQQHRQALERETTAGSEKRSNRAQHYALVVAIAAIIGGVILGLYGSAWAAGAAVAIVIAGVGGPAAAAIFARSFGDSKADE